MKHLAFLIPAGLALIACSNLDTIISTSKCVTYPEGYTPKGEVTEISTYDGNTIYMDSDSVFFVGDIVLTKSQVDSLLVPTTKGALIGAINKYWQDTSIAYHISSNFSTLDRSIILNGLNMISNNSYLAFHQVNSIPSHGISFIVDNQSNWSNVGCVTSGNEIGLYPGGFSSGTVAHEVMHALGFFHEQSRTDRDSYVRIYTENIESVYAHNFQKFNHDGTTGYNLRSYDYQSIMHYDSYAFSRNNAPTITKLDGSTFSAQRSYLTSSDKASLNYIYGPFCRLESELYYDDCNNDDQSIDERSYYRNKVIFVDANNTPVALTYPKKVIVELAHTERDASGHDNTNYFIQTFEASAGATECWLRDTERIRQEDMGIIRTWVDEWYNIIR